jgi:CheY-like chemotaxis protein
MCHPENAPEGTRAPEAAGEAAPATPAPRRVLVVDDNRDAADSLGMLLELMGNDARTAYDGPAALAVAASFRPAVALLDIAMPRMDGYEVARRLRQLSGLDDLILVALTGWGQEEDRQRAREAGFNHHLVKPIDLDTLQALLASL